MIPGLGILYLSIGTAVNRPEPVQRLDTVPAAAVAAAAPAPAQDTVRRRRPRSVEVSDWYSRRLTVHRYVSYSIIPVFAFQYAAGRQLFSKGSDAPTWAKTGHRVGAT